MPLDTGLAGLVHWPAALALAATSTLTAPRGVAAAQRMPVHHLKRAFGALLVAACVATVGKQVQGLAVPADLAAAAAKVALR
jgi:uncharacterized membrane protein YfcA